MPAHPRSIQGYLGLEQEAGGGGSAAQAIIRPPSQAPISSARSWAGWMICARQHDLIRSITQIYRNYGYSTSVLAASLKPPTHVIDSALAGSHLGTMPFKVMDMLSNHPLTDKGLEQFMKDWHKTFQENSQSDRDREEHQSLEIRACPSYQSCAGRRPWSPWLRRSACALPTAAYTRKARARRRADLAAFWQDGRRRAGGLPRQQSVLLSGARRGVYRLPMSAPCRSGCPPVSPFRARCR